MQRSKELGKRKSGFNLNRPNYLSADGKYYCYSYWSLEAKRFITQKLEVGKDLSIELTITLDMLDHDIDLQERYESELRDSLFDTKVNNYESNPNDKDAIDPWDLIADKNGSLEDVLFADSKPENPQLAQVRHIIDAECTESQRNFFFKHFGEGLQLEEIRQAEAKETGFLPSSAAMTNRKNKLINKVAKSFGVDPIKRHNYPQKNKAPKDSKNDCPSLSCATDK